MGRVRVELEAVEVRDAVEEAVAELEGVAVRDAEADRVELRDAVEEPVEELEVRDAEADRVEVRDAAEEPVAEGVAVSVAEGKFVEEGVAPALGALCGGCPIVVLRFF